MKLPQRLDCERISAVKLPGASIHLLKIGKIRVFDHLASCWINLMLPLAWPTFGFEIERNQVARVNDFFARQVRLFGTRVYSAAGEWTLVQTEAWMAKT